MRASQIVSLLRYLDASDQLFPKSEERWRVAEVFFWGLIRNLALDTKYQTQDISEPTSPTRQLANIFKVL